MHNVNAICVFLPSRYPCRWGGVSGGKPVLAGLEQFGEELLENVWLQIDELFPAEVRLLLTVGK